MTEQPLHLCDACTLLGPRPTAPDEAQWARDHDGGFRHGCGTGATQWAPTHVVDAHTTAIYLSKRYRCAGITAHIKVNARNAVIFALLAEVVAERAPAAWWSMATIVVLVALAVYRGGVAGFGAYIKRTTPCPHQPRF